MAQIKAEEISQIIKQRLASYKTAVDVAEVGTVLEVGDGIARIYGLDNAMAMEILDFPKGVRGMVLNLEEDNVGAVLLGDDTLISEGDQVRRTGRPGRPARRQGADRRERIQTHRTARAGRGGPAARQGAPPDRYQGD
jgi:F0F1-type ATP synthase alpha subunit